MESKLIKKLVFASKHILYVIIAQILVLHFVLAKTAPAQSITNVKISIHVDRAKLTDVLNAIKEQTDFVFSYPGNVIKGEMQYTMNYKKVSVDQVLTEVSEIGGFQYIQINNNISIIKSPDSQKEYKETTDLFVCEVEGKVLSLPDKSPLSFTNIGIMYTSVGTISNEDGSFLLKIPRRFNKDTLIFSALGYEKVSIAVSRFREGVKYIVYLKESPVELNTVTVKDDFWKNKKYRIGNRKYEGSCVYADTVRAGSAIALLIKKKDMKGRNYYQNPVFVRESHLLVSNNTFGKFKVRTRLYDVDSITGLPGKDILNQSVISTTDLENGWLKTDLSKYNIEVDGDFYLVFEWLLDEDDRNYLFLRYELFKEQYPDKVKVNYSYIDGEKVPYLNYQGNIYAGPSFGMSVSKNSHKRHQCFYRLNSFGSWYRSPSILAASVVLSDQPISIDNNDEPLLTFDNPLEELKPLFRVVQSEQNIESEDSILNTQIVDHDYLFCSRHQNPISFVYKRNENQISERKRVKGLLTPAYEEGVNQNISVYGKNNSYYPYQVELNFMNIKNLKPEPTKLSYKLDPGITWICKFNYADPQNREFHYDLSVKEIIGDSTSVPSKMYPYLFPVGRYREIGIETSNQKNKNKYDDVFKMSVGDTVYAMRKGYITATPVMDTQVDRVSLRKSLEMRHGDGTIMVFENMDPKDIFVDAGETVFPGQPLGTIGMKENLKVGLNSITPNGRLKKLGIHYVAGDGHIYTYNQIQNSTRAIYPDSIVKKEMTEDEVLYRRKRRLKREHSPTRVISGTVVSINDYPLKDINIFAQKANTEAITNAKGQFRIKVTRNDVLYIEEFHYLEYKRKIEKDDTIVNINLYAKDVAKDINKAIKEGHYTNEGRILLNKSSDPEIISVYFHKNIAKDEEKHYLYNDWRPGIVHLSLGISIEGFPLRYDLRFNLLEIDLGEEIKVQSINRIESFLLLASVNGKAEMFKSCDKYKNEDGSSLKGICKIHSEGGYSFITNVFYVMKEPDYNTALAAGNKEVKFFTKSKSLLCSNYTAYKKPRSKNTILKFFGSDFQRASRYTAQNELNLRKQNDLKALVDYMNKDIAEVSIVENESSPHTDFSRFANVYKAIEYSIPGSRTIIDNDGIEGILIRGHVTLRGINRALILVNGVIVDDISFIMPVDVISITKLSSTRAALYGSRGSNGVIAIETK